MRTVAFRLPPNADLKQSLLDYCIAQHIEAACILSCVGSLCCAEIRFAGCAGSARFDEKLEILSLSGTLSLHGCHLHVSVADAQGRVTGGHLMNGSRIYTTAEIVLGIIPDITFNRVSDPVTGYKELSVENEAFSGDSLKKSL